MASMALSCIHGDSEVSTALNRSLTYLLSKRGPNGSYGNEYSTSLTLQVFYTLLCDSTISTISHIVLAKMSTA